MNTHSVFTPCTTFSMGGKMISFQLPPKEEAVALRRASEANISALEAGGEVNFQLQEKWEKILLFLEEVNLLKAELHTHTTQTFVKGKKGKTLFPSIECLINKTK